MKVRIVGLLGLSCVLTATILISGSTTTQSQTSSGARTGSLSQPENDLLSEVNNARANPNTYATYLEHLKPLFSGREYRPGGGPALMTEEGWAAVEEAIRFLRATKPLPPLNGSTGLQLAAVSHVKDQSGSGATGHKGTDKSLIEERVKPYGSWQGAIGENLSYGNEAARERVLTWLIDDGFASRGHRKRLLSSDYRVVGVACGPHPEFRTMCCLTLAGGFLDLQPAKTAKTNTSTATKSSTTSSMNANSGAQITKPKPTSGKAPE
jgi:uncharacterized protein YkwD